MTCWLIKLPFLSLQKLREITSLKLFIYGIPPHMYTKNSEAAYKNK